MADHPVETREGETMQKEQEDLSRVEGWPLTATAELPHQLTEDVPPTAPEKKPYRIWTLYCPFKKSGFPSVGNFGSQINQVVIINIATWNRMCADIPGLSAAQFEVGTDE